MPTPSSPARRGLDRLLAAHPDRDVERVDAQLPHPIEVYDVDPDTGERAGRPYRRWDLPAGPWLLVKFADGEEFAIWKTTGHVYRVGPDGAVDEDPILEPSRRCPYCGAEAGDARAEVEHMNAEHRDVVVQRLEAAGFGRGPDDSWVDLLAGGDEERA